MAESKFAIVARLEQDGRSRIASYLKGKGYEVAEVSNGADAVDQARSRAPDLLVADGVLPKVSGFEVCRAVKAQGEPQAVAVAIILEANDNYGKGRARADGADLVLSEPLLEDDFADLVTVQGGDGRNVEKVLTGSSGSRDRFVKELLRGQPGKNDPIVARISDPLTGLHHKAYMTLKLEEEFKKSRRYGMPLALIMVDVDNYEDVVNTYGRPVAHEMLLEVAGIFLCESRDVDAAGRVDEYRFMLLLPSTDLPGARIMADRVFQQVCGRAVHIGDKQVTIRASVGVAAMPDQELTSVDEFLDRALRALRMASSLGGNRICAFGDAAGAKA